MSICEVQISSYSLGNKIDISKSYTHQSSVNEVIINGNTTIAQNAWNAANGQKWTNDTFLQACSATNSTVNPYWLTFFDTPKKIGNVRLSLDPLFAIAN
jgi:hypothetical protein